MKTRFQERKLSFQTENFCQYIIFLSLWTPIKDEFIKHIDLCCVIFVDD